MISGGKDLFPLKGLPGTIWSKKNVIVATKNVVKRIFTMPSSKVFMN